MSKFQDYLNEGDKKLQDMIVSAVIDATKISKKELEKAIDDKGLSKCLASMVKDGVLEKDGDMYSKGE